MGQMFSSLVGSSEENVRRAIQTPRASPRSSSGSTRSTRPWPAPAASAGSDGGTSARVFGTFLTWLSEKTAPVFVVCTANEIAHLPPELLRKGRLDEIFFVDLPSETEREEILKIHLKRRGRDPAKFDLPLRWPRQARGSAGRRSRRRSSPPCSTPSAPQGASRRAYRKNDGRNRAVVQDHERGNEPSSELGQRPGKARFRRPGRAVEESGRKIEF